MQPIFEDEREVLDHEHRRNAWSPAPLSAERYLTSSSTTTSDNLASSSPPAHMTYYEDVALEPSQFKFKLTYEDNSMILVVSANITYQSLIDRIDAELRQFCEELIVEGTLRMRYRDQDGDMCSLESDEDLQIAFQEQREMYERQNLAWSEYVIEGFCVKV